MLRCSLAALVLLAACGDNLAGVPFESVAGALATARCERLVRCGLFSATSECEARSRAEVDPSLPAAVAAGSVRFDALGVDACILEIASASCDETLEDARRTPVCDALLRGARAAGAGCELDEQCATRRCDRVDCQIGMCCAGTCAPIRQPLGGACDDDRDCDGDAACSAEGACVVLAEPGAACQRDAQCAYGAGCIGAGVEPGTCRDLPLLGERCLYGRCAEVGARCISTTCVAAGPGAPCTTAAQCSDFSLCDVERGVCTIFPILGEPCTTQCAGESYCDRTNVEGVCGGLLPDETPCLTDDQCASTLCEEGPFFNVCESRPVCT